jgi:hypothetical protein
LSPNKVWISTSIFNLRLRRTVTDSNLELEFLKSLWGLGTEEE